MNNSPPSRFVRWQIPSIVMFVLSLLMTVLLAHYTGWHWYVLWLLACGVITTGAYGVDKLAAGWNWKRIPERSLWLQIAAGGFLGGWVGQFAFRHKTRKWSFWLVLGLATLLHGVVAWFLWHHTGFR